MTLLRSGPKLSLVSYKELLALYGANKASVRNITHALPMGMGAVSHPRESCIARASKHGHDIVESPRKELRVIAKVL